MLGVAGGGRRAVRVAAELAASRYPRSRSATPTGCSRRACRDARRRASAPAPGAELGRLRGPRRSASACGDLPGLPDRRQGEHRSDAHARGGGDRQCAGRHRGDRPEAQLDRSGRSERRRLRQARPGRAPTHRARLRPRGRRRRERSAPAPVGLARVPDRSREPKRAGRGSSSCRTRRSTFSDARREKVYPHRIGFSTAMSRQFAVARDRDGPGRLPPGVPELGRTDAGGDRARERAVGARRCAGTSRERVRALAGDPRLRRAASGSRQRRVVERPTPAIYFGSPAPHIHSDVGRVRAPRPRRRAGTWRAGS